MDMDKLGYFLFMEEQEKEEIECAAVGEYKVNSNDDLVAEWGTQNEN